MNHISYKNRTAIHLKLLAYFISFAYGLLWKLTTFCHIRT